MELAECEAPSKDKQTEDRPHIFFNDIEANSAVLKIAESSSPSAKTAEKNVENELSKSAGKQPIITGWVWNLL